MKKNYFLLMCSVLMSFALFTTSCSDDETPAPEPTFPTKQTYTAVAGQTIEISFSANYDWTATISQDTYTYFQLLNGQTKTNTLNGVAGEQTIRVAVADVAVYDSAPVATVTLEMNGVEKVIAELYYPVAERSLSFNAPIVNDYGSFKSGSYGGEYQYSYAETAMAEGESIVMEWGVERGNKEEEPQDTFFAPVLVTADFAYTLVGPEWMLPTAAGEVGTQEHIIKADNTKIPDNTTTCSIDVLVAGTQTIVGSFDVVITGAKDFFVNSTSYAEYHYSYTGSTDVEFEGFYTAGLDTYLEILDPSGEQAQWLNVSLAKDNDNSICNISASILSMEANEGAVREAYIFGLPANVQEPTLIENGELTEAGQKYVLGKIIQHSVPATIEGTEIDDTCVTFSEIGPDFAYTWFFEDYALSDKYIGSKYDLYYWGEYAKYAHEYTQFTASVPVKSITSYAYNDMGSLAPLTEDAMWITSVIFGEDNTKFRIKCEDPSIIPAAAQNWQTGDYEAIVLVEHTDGSYSAFYFHFNEGSSSSSEGGMTFTQPDYASMMGASLTKLEAGNELYDQYFYEYSGDAYPADFYHLTYNFPITDTSSLNMVTLTGIESYMAVSNSDWCTWMENNSVYMNPSGVAAEGERNIGVIMFKDEMYINRVVILCELLSAE